MEIRQEGSTIFFNDAITEKFPINDIANAMSAAQKQFGKVVVDLAAVRRANSSGIMRFATALRQTGGKIVLARCPIWMVEQFNSTSEFFLDNLSVSSVFAPYLNSQDGSFKAVLVDVEKKFPPPDGFRKVVAYSDEQGNDWSADFDPEEYFGFISELKD